jgi:hypothetical protein
MKNLVVRYYQILFEDFLDEVSTAYQFLKLSNRDVPLFCFQLCHKLSQLFIGVCAARPNLAQ